MTVAATIQARAAHRRQRRSGWDLLAVHGAVALVRLPANVSTHDRRLRGVAQGMVARRLRFDADADIGEHGDSS